MSRQYNPAVAAYKRMDLNSLPEDTMQEKDTSKGLLARSTKSNKDNTGLDYSNPVVRVAKQMQIIRKYREDINGSK
jgi:hypothetical protein